jgi:hypothetical protein
MKATYWHHSLPDGLSGWLPPLLQRLKDNYKLFVTPAVGDIFYNTFYYSRPQIYSLSMSLDFYLYQRYSPYKQEQQPVGVG